VYKDESNEWLTVTVILEHIQTPGSKPQSPPIYRLGMIERVSYFLGETAAIRVGKVLKSKWKEVCLPEIQGEQLAICISPEIAWVDVVDAEPEDSTILPVEVDSARITGQGENLGWSR